MKDFFRLPKLLIKKKTKVLSDKEKEDLKLLVKKFPFSKKIDYGKISDKITSYDTIDHEKAWGEIEKKQRSPKNTATISIHTRKWLKYAAIFIGIAGVGTYLFQAGVFSADNPFSNEGGESITLQLENGAIEVITDNGEQKIKNLNGQTVGIQKKGQLRYKNEVDELVYNELRIPYGKKFELVLSDGTHIYLNSGTSIKYPIKFIEGQERQVYLNGEAYFDVAKDSLHPFTVNTEPIGITVLGTKFNVSAYPEDNDIHTVLVEGSVSVSPKGDLGHSILLKPNHKATWNKTKGSMRINKVHTDIYTSWTKGKLIFKDVPFVNISKRLERHYNVTIINKNEALKSEKFDAAFDIETIEQVFGSFKENHPSLNYTIKDDNSVITIY